MVISCIVAATQNWVIGKNNDIPWYLPADLKHFKKITSGHHILMGRKCYQSIGRPLPKRTNIIITRDPFFISSNCLVFNSIAEAIAAAKENGEEELFIIGGGMIYKQTQDLWDRIYFTEVHTELAGDVFFPEIDDKNWRLVDSESHEPDDKNHYSYTFKVFDRAPLVK
jgi:dihydrofolate reductase